MLWLNLIYRNLKILGSILERDPICAATVVWLLFKILPWEITWRPIIRIRRISYKTSNKELTSEFSGFFLIQSCFCMFLLLIERFKSWRWKNKMALSKFLLNHFIVCNAEQRVCMNQIAFMGLIHVWSFFLIGAKLK